MRTFQGLASALFDEGLTTMFGIIGDSNMHYIAHYVDTLGGRYIGTAHEASAMAMADGYWRSSGSLAVASVTHGPGFTNVITPLIEATRNDSPVIVVTGDTPRDRTYGQRLDIPSIVQPTGAGYEPIYRSETVVADVRRAVHRARTERRPIVINLPAELMNGETEEGVAGGRSVLHQPVLIADEDAIDEALGLIASANRPVVLAGHGAALSGARAELDQLADLLGAPVATTLMGLDFFRGNPLNLGVCGNLGSDLAIEVISEADCIVAFGAGLNRFTAGEGDLFRGKRIVQCVSEAARVGLYTKPNQVVIGDAKQIAARFVESLRAFDFTTRRWGDRYAERLRSSDVTTEYVDRSGGGVVDPRTAIARIDVLLPPSRLYVSDMGRFFKVWKYIHGYEPTSFTHTIHFGSIGLSLGTGIGAAVGDPERLVVVLVGDGGLMQYVAELSTAAQLNARLIVLVLNDGAYGMEYGKLAEFGDDPRHCLTSWPDLAELSRALGVPALVVQDLTAVDAVGKMVAELDGPCLVDIRLDPTLDILA